MTTAAYAEVSADGNKDQSSTSVILQLERGDVVDVGRCLGTNYIDKFSTFTGFLLRAN